MPTIEELEARLKSEEQRNAWLTEFLWRFGDANVPVPELQYHARRLASAADPNEGSRPKA